uniref:Uncharacterized protein n=1 Tax=Candidatus Kentrum sp. TUN TaxID=2126343 RepID=A0A450ZGX3_9GAMM|nr:MAG: hypothetical protein BECKTUN1418F_GA0071002_101622 [Candidatus Kentron sp. TUN]VFK53811.1 MAG: hypothetical protein BECKTUN1418E_GA0071001_101822 [Candidatus Kentron sp. TUN]
MQHSAVISSPLGMLAIMVSREGFLRKIELLPKGHRVNLRNSTHGNSQDSFTSGRSELSMSRYNYDSIIADIADQLGWLLLQGSGVVFCASACSRWHSFPATCVASLAIDTPRKNDKLRHIGGKASYLRACCG